MKHRILMIDDSPDDIRQVMTFLDSYKYDIESSSNPLEGLERARRKPPDIIILDIQMDLLDGFGVIGRLRNHPETKHTPIIIYSIVGDNDEIILRGLGLGAEHIVHKGRQKRFQILEATIERQLGNTRKSPLRVFQAHGHTLKVQGEAERVWLDDKEITLTRCQRMILALLIELEGDYISAQKLHQVVSTKCRGDIETVGTLSSIYKLIHDLRSRIEPESGRYIFLESQRDRGYRILAQV